MITRLILVTALLSIMTACTSKQCITRAQSAEPMSIFASSAFSAEAKAKLERIKDEYGMPGISVRNHEIFVAARMMPIEKLNKMKEEIQKVVGKDFHIEIEVK